MDDQLTITVCGMGNAGMAIAADISLMGFNVNAYETPQFSSNLDQIRDNGGVTLYGNSSSGKTGFTKFNKITSNTKEAIEDSDLIIIAVPAPAHESVMEHLTPHLQKGHVILVTTGYWASIRFQHLLESRNLQNDVVIAEGNIMPYLSGIVGPAQVHIFNYKRVMQVSTWPSHKKSEVYKMVKRIYPQYELAKNIFESNFYPGNLSLHVQIIIPKAAFLFERAREFKFYNEVSETASNLADAFDIERKKVIEAYDCETIGYVEWNKKAYKHTGNNLAELYKGSEISERWGKVEGIYRVIKEDICYSLVPLEQFAKVAEIKTPVTTAMIDVLQVMIGENYRENAITLKVLGLERLIKNEIIEFLNK